MIQFKRFIRLLFVGLAVVIMLPYVLSPLYRYINPVSTLMLWRWSNGARVERTWVAIDRIAPDLPRAVISAEDSRFCSHYGIDFDELREAIEEVDDIADIRGSSTITQQLAKNLFLWPGRSYVRKAFEFPLTLWLDWVVPKRRLMEIYLNIVEWGPNGEFGAEAASRRAFSKSARGLSLPEAALLAAVLPNPIRRDARRPGPGLRRLAGVYQIRARSSSGLDRCVVGS